jgi:hypothetical protein
MTALEAIDKMILLFGPNGENWIRGDYALDADGKVVESVNPMACKWCLIGMYHKLYGKNHLSYQVDAVLSTVLHSQAYELGFRSAISFNDASDWKTMKKYLQTVRNRLANA